MAELGDFAATAAAHSEDADFLVVYLEEAHPAERCHFTNNVSIRTHATLLERMDAARNLEVVAGVSLPCPVFVDTMENAANEAYAAIPERLYIIKDGRVAFVGGDGPMNYSIPQMEDALKAMI